MALSEQNESVLPVFIAASGGKQVAAVNAGLRVISSGRVFKDGVLGQGIAAKQIPGAFQVVDAATGKPIKGLRFKRVGTDLIAELDGVTVAIVDGFFESGAVLVTEEGCLSGRASVPNETYPFRGRDAPLRARQPDCS